MATVTLLESAKLSQNDLIKGIIATIIKVDGMFEYMPFLGIEGNALAYNRENTLGPVATTGIGDTDGAIGAGVTGTNSTERAAAKNAATFTQETASLTTIMGDAEVNGLIQATRSDVNDQTGVQIMSKTKAMTMHYRNQLINGDGTNFTFPGLLAQVPSGQTVAVGANGGAVTFAKLDEAMDLVLSKQGDVDFALFPDRTIRSFKQLLRGLGGAAIGEVLRLPSGREVPKYNSTPIFRNDYLPKDQTFGSGTALTSLIFGNWDDGSRQVGVSGLTAAKDAGIKVEEVGTSHTKDERIWRVIWYCGFVMFSPKGVAILKAVSD